MDYIREGDLVAFFSKINDIVDFTNNISEAVLKLQQDIDDTFDSLTKLEDRVKMLENVKPLYRPQDFTAPPAPEQRYWNGNQQFPTQGQPPQYPPQGWN